ncbi:MAG: DUF4915 domain-containing protein [Syntrophobacteraceae bacterium]|jgi:uncharacterized protein (TIGR03032 family)
MGRRRLDKSSQLWKYHDAMWRNPAQVVCQWGGAESVDPDVLKFSIKGKWREVMASTGVTLLVTREYEHLVVALKAGGNGEDHQSYCPLPHPSGLAVDKESCRVYVASTRNPNQIVEFLPSSSMDQLACSERSKWRDASFLVPVRARFFPGCLYIHDIALIGGQLYASSTGSNSLVRLDDDGRYETVWWPHCIDSETGPVLGLNYIQLNSIAAGPSIEGSFFSASSDKISLRRPGHRNFPVNLRGVIFSGQTREVIARGLTRPHSARLNGNQLWVNNSGYGETGCIENGIYSVVAKLPGWTRGLCFCNNIAFVGTSKLIPRFSQYAPGLDQNSSVCGVHAIDIKTGDIIGSLIWPHGSQIFSIEWLPAGPTAGFLMSYPGRNSSSAQRDFFYAFKTL